MRILFLFLAISLSGCATLPGSPEYDQKAHTVQVCMYNTLKRIFALPSQGFQGLENLCEDTGEYKQ